MPVPAPRIDDDIASMADRDALGGWCMVCGEVSQMNPKALAKQCADNINSRVILGLDAEGAAILIVTPKGWKAPPRFPRGKIVQQKEDGSRVRYLPAMKTLAWLVAKFDIKLDIQLVPAPRSDPKSS